ncbi:MAG TPA: hypothetical protein VHA33_27340 [Candidatus Angelobacter sp.]|nr:hypothetical protein [Candidatus Angelobacter sp.]
MVRWFAKYSVLCGMVLATSILTFAQPQHVCTDGKTVVANVVALYQPFMYNRLGAAEPQGMIFALESDVVPMSNPLDQFGNDQKLHVDPSQLQPGQVRLRSDKRARPLVLRVNQGECLEIHFRNLLGSDPAYLNDTGLAPNTNVASIHLTGLDLAGTINSDGSWVGQNSSSLAQPDGTPVIYKYFAAAEGTFILYSTGDIENAQNGQLVNGMFGAVNVQPTQAEYYRSQVTREDLHLATFNKNHLPPNMHLTPKMGVGGQPLFAKIRASVFATPVPAAQLNRQIFVLTTISTDRQTFQTADVVVDPDGYIYALDFEDEGNELEQGQYTARALPNPGAHTGHPVVNYAARYLANDPHGRACYPILKMDDRAQSVQNGKCTPLLGSKRQLFYTDLTAVITGPQASRFPYSEVQPTFNENSAEPDRREPYREFTIIYHNPNPVQAFEQFASPELSNVLGAGSDAFAINYGIAGIGAEILANRLGVGPEGNADAVDLKFEEFFLTSWAVGDPAMVVDVPANAQNQVLRNPQQGSTPPAPGECPANTTQQYSPGGQCVDNNLVVNEPNDKGWTPYTKQQATKAYYPDDPSNVYHSYMRDHVKFRILHAGGSGATHVHHLHAHQWLHSPNSADSQYLDSQMLVPGASYTLEITYGGSGNRNLTVGDSIFHCHFYPHFAGGMWSLWRVHDVFEEGTQLGPDRVTPVAGVNRVLPDGEIRAGTPVPALVPMPTLAMAPFPADVKLADITSGSGDHRRIEVIPDKVVGTKPVYSNPGYPFFVPGVAGHRAPHPPLDFAWKVDANGIPIFQNGHKVLLTGGLPRHLVLDGKIYREFHTNWDFTKDFVLYDTNHVLRQGNLKAFELPEEGTAVERAAMAAHSKRAHRTFLPNGDPGNFILNGLPPASGAPFASPGVTAFGDSVVNTRRYKGANIQIDTVLNKSGWHFPQQRLITLWDDVKPTVAGQRPPQPFFFRSTTGETVEYWQTNLVPSYYEMDDFEVRTPTDILGQHIHLVKFDVLASDGSSNGFNYEDGTLSSDEVRERIFAINQVGGLYAFDDGARQFYNPNQQTKLRLHPYPEDYQTPNCGTPPCPGIFGQPPAGQNWDGAQTTVQLWGTDPLVNNRGFDRTLRTVFTHDHFGPSTHQQAGLYAGLVVEPENSKWFDSTSGQQLYDTTSCYNPSTQQYQTVPGQCPSGTYRRTDGGPTTWQANIVAAHPEDSYREFALEFQDLQLAYTNQSISHEGIPTTPMFTNSAAITLTPGVIPANDPVRVLFSRNGITLTSQATAFDAPGGKCTGLLSSVAATYLISDPAPPDMNEQYCIANATSSASVYLPNMEPGWSDTAHSINSPGPGQNNTVPSPVIISNATNGTYSLNYRNEPVPSRVNSTVSGTSPSWCLSGTPSSNATDLSYGFSSIQRNDPCFNAQPPAGTPISTGSSFKFPPPLVPTGGSTSAQGTDPFTPMLRAYQGDKVQIRTLVGAHTNIHSLHIPGIKWMFEPSYANSGFRNTQGMGISEHWEMLFDLPHTTTTPVNPQSPPPQNPYSTDYVYETDAGVDGVTNGLWGILRAFDSAKAPNGGYSDLKPLPNNPMPSTAPAANPCSGKTPNQIQVVAISAAEALANQSSNPGQLIYNTRGQTQSSGFAYPEALMYVRKDDLNTSGSSWTLKPNVPVEPLILRTTAGSCIQVTLTNHLPGPSTAEQFQTNILQSSPFGTTNVPNPASLPVSSSAAVIPSLLFYDPNISGGMGFNVGFNNQQTANASGGTATVTWFAGNADGTPMEAGTVLLEPSDPLLQHFSGLVGVLVVEPPNAQWQEDANTRAAATVTLADNHAFRELVLVGQNDIDNQNNSGNFPNVQAGFNYRSEPFAKTPSSDGAVYRWPAQSQAKQVTKPKTLSGFLDEAKQEHRPINLSSIERKGGEFNLQALQRHPETLAQLIPSLRSAAASQPEYIPERYSNSLVGGDPETPILYTSAGMPVRIHMAFAGGTAVFPGVFNIHGHHWQEEPWVREGSRLGFNSLSQTLGMEQVVPYQVLNTLLDSAGGADRVSGDYLYEMFRDNAQNGMWGLLRVQDVSVVISNASTTQIAGSVMVKPGTTMPTSVTVTPASGSGCSATVNSNGSWSCSMSSSAGTKVTATAQSGSSSGSYTATVR